MPDPDSLIRRIGDAVAELPPSVVESVASALETASPQEAVAGIAHPRYRHVLGALFDTWQAARPDLGPAALAFSLLAAARLTRAHRLEESLELVWTGPDAKIIPVRQTEQVVLEVINEARTDLTVVSYSVYEIPRVRTAIVQAAGRGVDTRIVVDAAVREEGAYWNLPSLGTDVLQSARVFHWPIEKREKDSKGRHALLHAKCVVADSSTLFISSANLTEHAFSRNIELGILIRGTHLPKAVHEQFDRLIRDAVLVPVSQ